MKDDAELKAIEEYLKTRTYTITIGMSSKIQVNEYEPKTYHTEISIEKSLEDDPSDLHSKIERWLDNRVKHWEDTIQLEKRASVKPSTQTEMKDVVEGAKNGGKCKTCGKLMTVWKEGGVSKTTGKPYSGFWSCIDYPIHK